MILKTREIPLVRFRADLPAQLEPVGKAFVEIDARPAGMVNQAFMAARDKLAQAAKIREMRMARIEDEVDRAIAKEDSDRTSGAEWLGLVYDTCVIAWRTNLIDGETDQPLTPTRETFLDLADVRIPQVADMFVRFQTEVLQAGADAAEADAATIKN